MVSSNDIADTKLDAEYDLGQMQAHAAAGKIHFGDGRRLRRHLSRMGFPQNGEAEPVCQALATLTSAQFHRCEKYSSDKLQLWHDVYLLPNYAAPNGNTYNMYIKIRMVASRVMTIVCSFHPEGWK